MLTRLRHFSIRARFHLILGLTTLALLTLGVWGAVAGKSGVATAGRLFDNANAAAADATCACTRRAWSPRLPTPTRSSASISSGTRS
jgi:hypothetical protein